MYCGVWQSVIFPPYLTSAKFMLMIFIWRLKHTQTDDVIHKRSQEVWK